MDQSYMKTKSIFPLVMAMSVPNILSMLINSLYNIVDSFFVARISEQAMNAISIVYPIQNLSLAIAVGFGIGINAQIAQLLGRGEDRKAGVAGTVGMFLALVHGIVVFLVCRMVLPKFLGLYTQDADILAMGIQYGNIVLLFSGVQHLFIGIEKVYQSLGKMKTTMVCMSFGCIVNIILDPILIFGMGPIPAMGIAGAAWATGIGMTLELVLYWIVYLVNPIPVRFTRENLHFDRQLVGRLYNVGIPASLNMALPSLLISALNSILIGFSQVYIVVLGAYYKLQTFVYMPANGLIQGIRPLIGYNFGAGEQERVKKLYRLALLICAIMMVTGTAVCLLFPQWLMGLFANQPETIREGAIALRIISLGFGASAISITACGCMEGLGMGIPPLVISLLRYTVLIIPGAYVLSRFLGPVGVWHAFWVTELIAAVISWFYYQHALAAHSQKK